MTLFSKNSVTSKILFELKRSKDFSISDQLLQYLLQHEYPWTALGAALSKFVNACVQNTPQEERMLGQVHESVYIENADRVVIGKDAVIEPHAYIIGPAYIESNAVIRHGAYVRGPVYVSSYAVVGHTTECKGSILLPHAKAAHFNYVGDSILGFECNLGAGTKLANLKHNHSNIILRFSEEHLNSNLKKFGAIIGNRVSIGCNAVTNPGTILLPDAILNPNQTAIGIINK